MAGFLRTVNIAAFVALLSLGTTERANAQAALLGPGAAFIGAGSSGIETQELDDRLASLGYPTFGRRATAITLGAYRTLSSKVMLGGEFHGLIIGEEPHAGGEVGLGGGYATLGIGYAMALSRRARFYPRLGLGVGGFGLWIEEEAEPIGFDDVLSDPQPSADLRDPVLSRDGLVVDVGAGMELLKNRRGSGPLIGMRFGYLFAPFDSSWDFYERNATGGPDATISGAYVRVVLGGAWKR